MIYMIIGFLFLLGACFWSFGGVILLRNKEKDEKELWIDKNTSMKDFVKTDYKNEKKVEDKKNEKLDEKRSYCPVCKTNLKWYNLIPIFSWIFQWWKCSNCKTKIPFFYPFIEIVSGLIFVSAFLFLNWLWYNFITYTWIDYNSFIVYTMITLIFWGLMLLVFYDFMVFLLLDKIFYFLIAMYFISLFIIYFILHIDFSLYNVILPWIIFLLFYSAIYFFWKFYVRYKMWIKDAEWFWMGDVIIGGLLWFLLSIFIILFPNLTQNIEFNSITLFTINFIIIHLIVSCITSIIIYGGLLLFNSLNNKKNNLVAEGVIPFLPSMIIWFIIVLLYYMF